MNRRPTRRRVAAVFRSYAMAVAVNVAIAAALPPGIDGLGRPAIVRRVDGRRDRFDPREIGRPGTVLTVPLVAVGGPDAEGSPARN